MGKPSDNREAAIDALLKYDGLRELLGKVVDITIEVHDDFRSGTILYPALLEALLRRMLRRGGPWALTRTEYTELVAILLVGIYADDDLFKKDETQNA
jgi:hypothetical protein